MFVNKLNILLYVLSATTNIASSSTTAKENVKASMDKQASRSLLAFKLLWADAKFEFACQINRSKSDVQH